MTVEESESDLALGSAYLIALSGSMAGRKFFIAQEMIVGRDPDSTIQLTLGEISRHHARIWLSEGNYILEDLGSQNGTFVNSEPISKRALEIGDRIQFGTKATFFFAISSPIEDQLMDESKMDSAGQLAAGVAHDFNNLMAVVLVDIDFLRQSILNGLEHQDEVMECLDNIEAASKRAASLTKQLLGFAKRGKYENRPVDLSQLVDELVDLLKETFEPAITIQADVEAGLGVQGDRNQLHQVLIDLCNNAKDAMPQGGSLFIHLGKMHLAQEEALLRPTLQVGDYIVIELADTGEGIPAGLKKKIFEPFFSTKESRQHSGMGLATAYGIVRNHGGTVDVKSEVGKGTTFQLFLPALEMISQEASARATVMALPVAGTTILVVEDVDRERTATAKTLKDLGYQVLEAADGREAVKTFVEHREAVKLVFLDMIMPNLSGKETFRWLKKIDPNVKVLITSGYLDQSRVDEALIEGVCGFLEKPYGAEELEREIYKALVQENPVPLASRKRPSPPRK